MRRPFRALTFALLAGLAHSADAQMVVSGALATDTSAPKPVVQKQTMARVRSSRRESNRYFAARPVYPPAKPGARANITFEPYTRWYYPNQNSYYPPLSTFPSIRSR